MTAEEYLDYLISVARGGSEIGVQAAELELLKKLIKEGKTGVFVP
jgi:hypothetical protein